MPPRCSRSSRCIRIRVGKGGKVHVPGHVHVPGAVLVSPDRRRGHGLRQGELHREQPAARGVGLGIGIAVTDGSDGEGRPPVTAPPMWAREVPLAMAVGRLAPMPAKPPIAMALASAKATFEALDSTVMPPPALSVAPLTT